MPSQPEEQQPELPKKGMRYDKKLEQYVYHVKLQGQMLYEFRRLMEKRSKKEGRKISANFILNELIKGFVAAEKKKEAKAKKG